ncbi:MAG TPA: cytidine deaminase [Dongiaceae bacterium]|jgi:cytidine deaminase|nr:cytidine deaminase [Dongiaceae bacterium]
MAKSSMARLVEAAKNARAQAHAPYSKFKVGAAILADDGRIYSGCNVENAAYPNGVCAETSAISAMVLGGGKRIREIAVIGSGRNLVTPCGGCRQRIAEFATADTPVHICGPQGPRAHFTIGELLPESFGMLNLRQK